MKLEKENTDLKKQIEDINEALKSYDALKQELETRTKELEMEKSFTSA